MNHLQIKLTFISGLQQVVLEELSLYPQFQVVRAEQEKIYLEMTTDFDALKRLRSVVSVYIVTCSKNIHPVYISHHKSIVGDLIQMVLEYNKRNTFYTYTLSCAGRESIEVKEIETYIENTYALTKSEEADMEIYIGKVGDAWEVGVRLTARPLSLREYKVENIKGGLNPTIAYAMNTLCNLQSRNTYLNIFSGSATLLIEAGLSHEKIKLVGFDINKKSVSAAIQNIKKAGLIQRIELKAFDIFTQPNLGTFDVITSDLPFGMQIGKGEDLRLLYTTFVEYCSHTLNPEGVLVVYTTEYELFEEIVAASRFAVVLKIQLKVSTIVNVYIRPKIFVCRLKE